MTDTLPLLATMDTQTVAGAVGGAIGPDPTATLLPGLQEQPQGTDFTQLLQAITGQPQALQGPPQALQGAPPLPAPQLPQNSPTIINLENAPTEAASPGGKPLPQDVKVTAWTGFAPSDPQVAILAAHTAPNAIQPLSTAPMTGEVPFSTTPMMEEAPQGIQRALENKLHGTLIRTMTVQVQDEVPSGADGQSPMLSRQTTFSATVMQPATLEHGALLDTLSGNLPQTTQSSMMMGAHSMSSAYLMAQTWGGGQTESSLAPINVMPQNPNWGQAVGERIQWMLNQNLQQAEVRLNPPELGALEVRVSVNSEQTNITFTSPHASVREALEAAIPRLREMFSDSGLNLGDVNVSHQSLADQRNSGGEAQLAKHAHGEAPLSEEEGIQPIVLGRQGLLDLYV